MNAYNWKKQINHSNREYNYQLSENQVLHNLINLRQLTFEVTDSCNLNCKYCGYGPLYSTHEKRENNYMTFDMAKSIIDYLFNIWKNNSPKTYPHKITFGFYGGEPLLNFSLIKQVIKYIEEESKYLPIVCRFNMTSNAVLLDKYQDYLSSKNVDILISLDGNEWNNSYRVDHCGKNSFQRVFNNICQLKKKYPKYFEEHISFNAVLHNRSTTKEIREFIYKQFGKYPMISEMNNYGIVYSKKDLFESLYHRLSSDISSSTNIMIHLLK